MPATPPCRAARRSSARLEAPARSEASRATAKAPSTRSWSRSASAGWVRSTRSCSACTPKGLTTGEISAHLADVYGASVSTDTVSRITDRVIEEMQAWWARPLEKVYAAIFIDAIMVKIRVSTPVEN